MGAVELEQASVKQLNEFKGVFQILYMLDPIDENAVKQLSEFKGLEVLYMMDLVEELRRQACCSLLDREFGIEG